MHTQEENQEITAGVESQHRSAVGEPVTHNPHLPCELQQGHMWSEPLPGKNILEMKITVVYCLNCGRTRA